jgi:hypothetical protein
MLRAASTLQYQLACELVEGRRAGRRLGWLDGAALEAVLGDAAVKKEMYVLKTHAYNHVLGEMLDIGEARSLYSFRDLRDVALSICRKFRMDFNNLMEKGWLAAAVEDGKRWCGHPNVMSSRYEDLITNVPNEAERIATHLGIRITGEEAEAIGEKFSWERQKSRIASFPALEKTSAGDEFDPETLLHRNHLFSGIPGEWRRLLDTRDASRIDEEFGNWLREHGYTV